MKKILTILMCLLLIPIAMAYTEPEIIAYEEPTQNWFQRLFNPPQFTALGGSFSESTVTKGNYVDATVRLKFYHDCEKYKLDFWFMSPGQIGGITKTVTLNYPHKTGDETASVIRNIPTSQIPDSYCGKQIKGYVKHYSYWGGYEYGDNLCHKSEPIMSLDCQTNSRLSYDKSPSWHREEGSYLDTSFILKCQQQQCEEKPIGSLFCNSDGNVAQKWQWEDCSTDIVMMDYCFGRGCSNGKCVDTSCETGSVGSKFCKENSVYQRFGLGLVATGCKYEDRLVQPCSENQICDSGQCIDQDKCGDGYCNNDETYNSCEVDCPKNWECGDNVCNSDETEENCPIDCQIGCSEGEEQKETCEDETIIIAYICQDSEWIETGNECEDKPKIPSWLIPVVIGVVFVGGIALILLTGKKKKRRK